MTVGRRLDPRCWPIRWRLAALNLGAAALTLVALGGLLLWQLDGALLGLTAEHLREQARRPLQIVREPRPPGPVQPGGPPAQLPAGIAAQLMVRELSGPETGVRVFDPSLAVLAESFTPDTAEAWPRPDDRQLRAALEGLESSAVVDQQTRRTLLLLLPVRAGDGSVAAVLELAGSLQFTDRLQDRLRAGLFGLTLVAMVLAGLIGLRATQTALRPLDRVIRAAREIGAGRLDQRLRMQRSDEIGELAEAFDSMLDRLESVFAAQRQFVADAAHELRTPLTALGGMVEVLQMGADRGDRETVRRMLGTMEREIGRLGRLVGDLLTLSRLDAAQALAREPVALAPLVAEVAAQTRLLAHGQAVEERIDAAPTVLGDADRLKQVLLNLTANALAATPPDGRIELRLSATGQQARIEVVDNGRGIDPELLPRITERFVRGDPSRTRATGGSGLGLAIVRGLVEAHHGTLTLRSHLGAGTTAAIVLPLLGPGRPSAKPQLSRAEA